MSFLQPILLAALPLVALPIIIHLINQRRYQTVRWAAMMFLLAANRMSRGYARVRQWLIMAMRMAAIAALIFAVSRPLAGGWLGLTAGGTLETLGSARWVLIDSNARQPRELERIDGLLTTPNAAPASASADVPAMLLSALDYVKANKTGRTEIWICSDIRENDWYADSGRWQALRDGFAELTQGVRFHLLAYPDIAAANLSVWVTGVRRQQVGDAAELLVSLKLSREKGGDGKESVPVQFEIEGARSEVMVELAGGQAELKDHRIPIEKARERGWGRVSIPADANLADNDFWFVFEQPAPRQTIIVVEDPQAARPLQLAASISPGPLVKSTAEVVLASQLAAVDWERVSLVLWQAPLPDAEAGKPVRTFVERGGSAIFFPARVPGTGELFGVRWTSWADVKGEAPVESWRGDQDLLARTASGQPLPVGQLRVSKACGLSGEVTPLATLRGGAPLLARVATGGGPVYFCATTPAPGDSSLATSGIVFYVLVQRALAGGAAALANTRQLTAGAAPPERQALWQRVAGAAQALSTDYPFHRGIYQDGDKLLAVNRAAGEASAPVLADRRVADLFQGLDYARLDDSAGSLGSLIQEIWRLFLVAMMVAMVVEAGLSLPRVARPGGASS
jgi:hypothetical protein